MAGKLKEKLLKASGFSLLEVLLAVLLLAIVVTPLIQVITTSMNLNMRAKRQQGANDIAQAMMEYLQGMTVDEIDIKFKGNGGSTVTLPFCNYSGPVQLAENGCSAIIDHGNRSDNFRAMQGGCALIGYTDGTVMGSSDVAVFYSDVSNYERMYCVNTIKQGGNCYDVIIRIDPLTNESNEYVVYDLYVEVHLVDYTRKVCDQCHDTANTACLCTVHGSCFNKFH